MTVSLTRNLHKHGIFILFSLTILALFGVIKFYGLPLVQFQILIALSIVYLGWALIYHGFDKSLTLEVVVEYVLTALLAVIILYGILI